MPAKITIKNNSSIRIEGDFEIFDQHGTKFDPAGRTYISLCRCGHTKDAPFCDSTHKLINFKSEVTAHPFPPPKKKI